MPGHSIKDVFFLNSNDTNRTIFFKIHFRIVHFRLQRYMKRNFSELYVTGIYFSCYQLNYTLLYICANKVSFINKYANIFLQCKITMRF